MVMRKRLIAAAVVLVLGLAVCFGMYWWQLRYQYALHGLGLPIATTIPFVLLAALVLGGMGRALTAVSFFVLAFLTGTALLGVATSPDLLAGLVFIPLLVVESIALPIVFAIESIVPNRNALSRRGGQLQ